MIQYKKPIGLPFYSDTIFGRVNSPGYQGKLVRVTNNPIENSTKTELRGSILLESGWVTVLKQEYDVTKIKEKTLTFLKEFSLLFQATGEVSSNSKNLSDLF